MSYSILKNFFIGLSSPFYSARFLFQKKSLFILGVLPHILNFFLYFWIVKTVIIARWLHPFLTTLSFKEQSSFFAYFLNPTFFESLIWLVAFLLYSILGTSFVNAVASPVYDYIAEKTYEHFTNKKLPKQTFEIFLLSTISEFTKAMIVFCVLIISLFVHIFLPILFLFSFWYLGWNSIDRTLLLLNISLRNRLRFGLKYPSLCIGLGVWCYIPILSTLFSFSTAAAGAFVLSKVQDPILQN